VASAAAQQGRHAGGKAGGVHTLDAEDADIAVFEAGDEVAIADWLRSRADRFQHHRPADEEAGRTGQRCVYFLKPARDRNHRRKMNAT